MIYLDNFASTPCDPEVQNKMLHCATDMFGNPHSHHHDAGQRAATRVAEARTMLADLIGVTDQEIIFTSGATEANNLAIKGAARHLRAHGDPRRRIITCATEHKCVLESVNDLKAEGFEPVVLPVDDQGRVSPAHLTEALREPSLLVSIMAANNETGILQDIPALSRITRQHHTLFHTDAAQILGKLPFCCRDIDLASFSAHKLYGPMGVGALYVRRRPRVRLTPLFSGGGQERGLRSGTVPVPLVAGFGRACQIAAEMMDTEATRIAALRDRLQEGLMRLLPGSFVNGGLASRLPGGLNICFKNGPTSQAMMAFTQELAYSSGSACMSADIAPSYVLGAMGLPRDDALRSLRLSIGRFTASQDITRALDIFKRALHAV